MKTFLLAAAATTLFAAQAASAFAQATADERTDRTQSARDSSGMHHDSSEILGLNAQVRAVHLRMKRDHGAALEADRKQLARLQVEESRVRSQEAGLKAQNQAVQKDYHKDLSAPKPK